MTRLWKPDRKASPRLRIGPNPARVRIFLALGAIRPLFLHSPRAAIVVLRQV